MMNDDQSDSTDSSSGNDSVRQREADEDIIYPRPKASAGYWLCCLLPLAFTVQYARTDRNCNPPPTYKMISIAATGMCIESLCFFMYMFLNTGLLLKLIISFVPGILTAFLYTTVLQQSWKFGLFWGFAVTFCYQNVYIRGMQRLPKCFTFGEAAVVVQGLMLFILNAVLQLPGMFSTPKQGDFNELNAIMMSAFFCLIIACWFLSIFERLRRPATFYTVLFILLLSVTCMPITRRTPIITLFLFIANDRNRAATASFYFGIVALTVCTVWGIMSALDHTTTSMRKIFHLVIILVYIPGLFYQCSLLYIATGIALAVFTVLELCRILDMPPLNEPLQRGYVLFCDEKDAGALALTPFYLLIGCSLPLWICACPCDIKPTFGMVRLLSGVLSIGFGDSAASIIGSKYGRIKWRGSRRTVEGTIAFVLAVMLAICAFHYSGYIPLTNDQWFVVLAATVITALIEARTNQIDNLVLPLVFYIIVSFG